MTLVYTLNAFTDLIDGGNPAGVVPAAEALTEETMQQIAKVLGFSETAFVQPSKIANFRLRFFTPSAEVDLCGHATIATFTLLYKLGKVQTGIYSQETRAGVLDIEISSSGEVFMTQAKPQSGDFLDRHLIANSLNIQITDLHPELKPQLISTGLWDVIVPIRDLRTLNAIKPDFAKVSDVSKQFGAVGYHLVSLETLYDANAHCRNLAPLYEIPEEAATGTASGALAAYLIINKVISPEAASSLVFEQGYSMNRPSTIKCRLQTEGSDITKVVVGGTAVLVDEPRSIEQILL